MPTANLLDEDDWTATPVGPGTLDPIVSAIWRGYWDKVNNRVRYLRNRLLRSLLGEEQTFLPGAVDTTADTISIPGHGLSTDMVIRFGNIGGTPISVNGVMLDNNAGFSGTAYYAIAVDANTLSITAVAGGPALDLTAAGTGTHLLFAITAPLRTIVHDSFTPVGAVVPVPAGSLYSTLRAYYLSIWGGNMAGKIKHIGNSAEVVGRVGQITNAATSTITVTQKDFWDCPNVSQNSTITINDPTEEGQQSEIGRTIVGSGFAALFKRSDASTIGNLPNTGVGGLRLRAYDNGDGKGLAWHAMGYGGATLVS